MEPPYYAVIFTSVRRDNEDGENDGYATMAARMEELGSEQPGYLGIESARSADGLGITVSYWRDLESIAAWKAVSEHRIAQERGVAEWYRRYTVRICRVERAYSWGDS